MSTEAEEILRRLYHKDAYQFSDKSGTHCNCCGVTRLADSSDSAVRHRLTCDLALAAKILGIPHEYVAPTERRVKPFESARKEGGE